MKTTDNRHYYADDNKVLVRISDDFIMGTGLDLGVEDSIDNYREDPMPEGYTEPGMEKEINKFEENE